MEKSSAFKNGMAFISGDVSVKFDTANYEKELNIKVRVSSGDAALSVGFSGRTTETAFTELFDIRELIGRLLMCRLSVVGRSYEDYRWNWENDSEGQWAATESVRWKSGVFAGISQQSRVIEGSRLPQRWQGHDQVERYEELVKIVGVKAFNFLYSDIQEYFKVI